MADELLAAARDFHNATVADPSVIIRCESAASRDAVTTASERLRLALLNQHPALIPTDDLQVVAASASGAHEVQPETVDAGLDLVESGERDVAADALKHGSGVRPEHDGAVTAMVERKPYGRTGDEMDLPEGKTCGDCVHCRRCTAMFGHIPADESCDWSPARYREADRSHP